MTTTLPEDNINAQNLYVENCFYLITKYEAIVPGNNDKKKTTLETLQHKWTQIRENTTQGERTEKVQSNGCLLFFFFKYILTLIFYIKKEKLQHLLICRHMKERPVNSV